MPLAHRAAATAADRPPRRQRAGLRRLARGCGGCRLPRICAVRHSRRVRDASDPDDLTPTRRQREFPARPDLVLIDGGQGQLGVARECSTSSASRDVPLDRHRQGPRPRCRARALPFARPRRRCCRPRDPVLYFVQRLRDEAHRFAIGSHRAKRRKAIARNPLDEIAGIGPAASARCSSISAPPRRSARAGARRPAARRRHLRGDRAADLRFLP